MPRKERETFLGSTLGELSGYWLRIHCGRCGGGTGLLTDYPLSLMARERGRGLFLRAAIERLRCRQCGGRPTRVEITDDVAAGALGGKPPSWRVVLLGDHP